MSDSQGSALGVVLKNSLAKGKDGNKGGKDDGGKSAYGDELRVAMPVINTARGLDKHSKNTAPALKSMSEAMDEAAKADIAGDYGTASSSLKEALKQAGLATEALRGDLLQRHGRTVTNLGDRPKRIGDLTACPAPVTQSLKTATDARDAAKKEIESKTADWDKATSLLGDFGLATNGLNQVCIDEANKLALGYANRCNTVNSRKTAGLAVVKAYTDYGNAKKGLDTRVKSDNGVGALEACEDLAAKTTALETAANPSDRDKQNRATAAFNKLKKISTRDLKKMSTQEKAELALELSVNGLPTGEARDEMVRLFNNSPPDKEFLKQREKQREAITAEVSKMPELTGLYDKKGKLDKKAWENFTKNPDNVKNLLEKVGKAQTKVLGMPDVPVVKEPDPPQGVDSEGGLTFGGYEPDSNTINLNLHPLCLKPIEEALGTILHETFHGHQDVIVKKLKAGEIQPGDPDYPTALMYMVNDIGVGYWNSGKIGQKNYERQPTEIDAEFQGNLAAKGILKQISKDIKAKPKSKK